MRTFVYICSAVFITLVISVSSWTDAATRVRAAATCTPKCGNCTYKINGNWNIWIQNDDQSARFHDIYTLSQSGNTIKSTDLDVSNSIYGSIEFNKIDFTFVVNGEETEWWSMHCEGHVFGPTRNRLAGVCRDVSGWVGSLTGNKQ